jgi:hypothetical protein
MSPPRRRRRLATVLARVVNIADVIIHQKRFIICCGCDDFLVASLAVTRLAFLVPMRQLDVSNFDKIVVNEAAGQLVRHQSFVVAPQRHHGKKISTTFPTKVVYDGVKTCVLITKNRESLPLISTESDSEICIK